MAHLPIPPSAQNCLSLKGRILSYTETNCCFFRTVRQTQNNVICASNPICLSCLPGQLSYPWGPGSPDSDPDPGGAGQQSVVARGDWKAVEKNVRWASLQRLLLPVTATVARGERASSSLSLWLFGTNCMVHSDGGGGGGKGDSG